MTRRSRVALGVLAIAVVAAALVLALIDSPSHGTAAVSRTVNIGALFSLTGGGDVYGPQQERGARLAISQINGRGGVDGAQLRLVVLDDASTPATGTAVMRKVIDTNQAVAVLGPSLSLVAVAADPVASALHTPVVAVSNTADGIVGKCAYDCSWVWRDSLGESTAVPANIDSFLASGPVASAAIISVAADKLAIDETKIATQAFASRRIPLVASITTPQIGSVVPAVRAVLAKHPAVIFVGATFGALAANIMIEARKEGYAGPFLGGNTFNSAATTALAGAAGIGARSGAAWYAGNDFPANQDFIAAYRQLYGTDPDQFSAQAYVGVQIVADAMRRGDVAHRRTLADKRDALRDALPAVALTTPVGDVRFTENHDVAQTVWILRITAAGHALVGFCAPTC